MNTVKKCIGDTKHTETYTLVCKINYISSDDNDYVERINSGIAERLLKCFASEKPSFGSIAGNILALLTPSVTYFDESIISIRYDFIVTNGNIVVFHKRFCVNLLYELGIFLLPGFLKSKKHKPKGEFYLKESENGIVCTPVLKSIPAGTILGRRREIDLYSDGKTFEVNLTLPEYLKAKK